MLFNSYTYLLFLLVVVSLYWSLRRRVWQNAAMLVCSYVFYGWVHPWFCILIAASTLIDYVCARSMEKWRDRGRLFLTISLVGNLGMLGFFKYFNFFVENAMEVLAAVGFQPHPLTLSIFLPAGISFYTFQSLSYTIDVYRGEMHARRSLLDFALYVSFFPQLIAGPIERAQHFLPQVEATRRWSADVFLSAFPLLLSGYLRKMVVADNVAPYVNQIFLLEHPPVLLLALGAFGFAIQIYADFSGYTDIARGSARLMGFDLMLNFKSPYLAVSPSDFWRRWHISFSSWIRDYLYIPLGGSRVSSRWMFLGVLLVSMGLSGLWHGAAWTFVLWGIYSAVLLWTYHQIGLGGRWSPSHWWSRGVAIAAMFCLTLLGWLIFRAPSVRWLWAGLSRPDWGASADQTAASVFLAVVFLLYASPLLVSLVLDRVAPRQPAVRGFFAGVALVIIVLFGRVGAYEFIYFQF